ncbi:MAG: histidinol dehydrogenase [Nitriliruptoraceae bacterium]
MPRLTLLDLRGDRRDPTDLLPRPRAAMDAIRGDVQAIIDDVRKRGDSAIVDYNRKFDGVKTDVLEVPREICRKALDDLEPRLRAALERAIDQVRWFHERARPADWREERDGAVMGQWHRPIHRAGVYVPGGKAVYPSTVIMTVVPALVAGVEEIVLCTPPTGDDELPNRTILAAAELLGVTRVMAIGGAQAIAAMAHGTETVASCDMVVGPGNAYVAVAKQLVQASGACGIDALAGPTEIAIVADATADPAIVAADLVAQAEHDEMAGVVLITTDPSLVASVEEALATEVAATRHQQRVEAALAGQGTVVLVDDITQAIQVAEAYAAEHLEIQTEDARSVAERIRYAGTTFIGADTPVSLGDYAAGPNHTLPVLGTARFTGGLTTASYMVTVNHVEYDAEALRALAPSVEVLAAAEGLPAHWRAVEIRLARDER